MKLNELLRCLPVPVRELPEDDIRRVTDCSSQAGGDSLFVCIRGCRSDGHAYAQDAYGRGCRAFLAEHPLTLPADAAVICVPDTRRALGALACRFYGDPSRELRVIGTTGTKGKTTTACLLARMLGQCGIPCGYIGTNGIHYGSVHLTTRNTTPDALTLQKSLRDMQHAGCRAAVVEVSSQALKQYRVEGMHFDTVLFTNLSHDHIGPDEHPDFADYAACKHRLFTDFGAKTMIYNADDPHAVEMLQGASAATRISCAMHSPADFAAREIRPVSEPGCFGLRFTLLTGRRQLPCLLPLIGQGNVTNALLAVACAVRGFGIPLRTAAGLLPEARIDGRSEVVPLPGGVVAVIDYAHNGVSLRQLLTNLREYRPARLICLFGSVGGRTALRRAELGRVAAELADFCILTSDNPGTEPPEQIIADIAQAFEGCQTPYLRIPDRAEAIQTAVRLSRAGDILVLAGKGHERYQLIGNEKIPFCERELLLAQTAPLL